MTRAESARDRVIAGRYRVTSTLARGGMGRVLEAFDETLRRSVAIKILRRELLSDADAAARFEREALAVARLSHPGVVQVYDMGRDERGERFVVMELVRGPTLSQLLGKEGALAPRRAVDLAIQALHVIEHAHAQGIVHRDIKPGNVMIARHGEGPESVKVLDFGIALLKTATGYTRLTQTGEIVGTPAFMSPEQALGHDIDGRADVYAVGALLWTMLTGRRMFPHQDLGELIVAVCSERPQRADAVLGSVPAQLADVCDRALSKSPDERFQTASAMRLALEAWAVGAPVAEAPSRIEGAPIVSTAAPVAATPAAEAGVARPSAAPLHESAPPAASSVGHGHADAAASASRSLAPPSVRAPRHRSLGSPLAWVVVGSVIGGVCVTGWAFAGLVWLFRTEASPIPAVSNYPQAPTPSVASLPEPVAHTRAAADIGEDRWCVAAVRCCQTVGGGMPCDQIVAVARASGSADFCRSQLRSRQPRAASADAADACAEPPPSEACARASACCHRYFEELHVDSSSCDMVIPTDEAGCDGIRRTYASGYGTIGRPMPAECAER